MQSLNEKYGKIPRRRKIQLEDFMKDDGEDEDELGGELANK